MTSTTPPDVRGRSFLARLEPALGERLLSIGQRRRLRNGETLIRLGQLLDGIFVVDTGLLGVAVPDRNGRPTEIARHGPGDLCGEMSFLTGERAAADIVALSDTEVLFLPQDELEGVAAEHPTLMAALASCVADRLGASNRRLRRDGGGYAIAVLSAPHSDWAMRLLARATRRAASLLGVAGLTIDLDNAGEGLAGAAASATLSRLAAGHDDLPVVGPGELLALTRGPDASIDDGWLAHAIDGWRERFGVISLRASDPGQLSSRVFADLAGPLMVLEEGGAEEQAATRHLAAIYLRRSPGPGTPGERLAIGRARGGEVLHVVPGGERALEHEDDAASEAAVDWTARHIIERKVGIALGAGGSKGYAHLGVLRELQRLGVPIDYVAGCSIGAPIAAGVAAGWPLDEIKRNLDTISRKAVRPTLPTTALLSAKPVHKAIGALAQHKQFEELDLPLALVAVDIRRREEVVLRAGDVAEAIFASFAIPAFYPPFEIDGRALVDGALLNPVPIATARDLGADIVIAIRLTNPVDSGTARPRRRRLALRAPPIIDVIQQAFEVMQWKIATSGADQPEIMIEPAFEGSTGLRDFHRGDEFEEVGRRAAVAARSRLVAHLPWIGATSG